MSAFLERFREYEQLTASQNAIGVTDAASQERFDAAVDLTEAALQRLLICAAENGNHVAVKLATAMAEYPSFGGGMNEGALSLLASECIRFLVAGELRAGRA